RARGPGGAQVAAAAARGPDGGLRHQLPQVRRRQRGRVARVPDARAAHRAAEADRRDGRSGRRVPELARLPARGRHRVQARRAAALHGDDGGARRARHRRVPRRGAREDPILERFQASRQLVGRAAALLALLAARALYYAFHERLWDASLWWDIAFLGLVLIPACFALVWLVLPLRIARGLLAAGAGLGVLAWAFHVAG